MGKAYANRKKEELRHKNDFYPTPKCLTWELLKTGELDGVHKVLEPCFGEGAISNILKENGFLVTERDLNQGNDFLKDDYSNEHYECVITNPPFDLWDKFVEKSKTIADKVILIGRKAVSLFNNDNNIEVEMVIAFAINNTETYLSYEVSRIEFNAAYVDREHSSDVRILKLNKGGLFKSIE